MCEFWGFCRSHSSALHFGEVGLCVTLVEAALQHLFRLKPEQCGLPSYLPLLVQTIDQSFQNAGRTEKLEIKTITASPQADLVCHERKLQAFALFIPFLINTSDAQPVLVAAHRSMSVTDHGSIRGQLDGNCFSSAVSLNEKARVLSVSILEDSSGFGPETAHDQANEPVD